MTAELDRILLALAHPVRRKIIELLEKEGELEYSAILREVGVESSALSFHIKKLQGLVEKSRGVYKLTEQGLRAAHLLKCLYSERGVNKPEPLHIRGAAILVNDDLLLESYKRGSSLVIEAPLVIIDNNVSQSLYSKTIKAIRGIVVYSPINLYSNTLAKAKALLVLPYKKKPPCSIEEPYAAIHHLIKKGYNAVAARLTKELGISTENIAAKQ